MGITSDMHESSFDERLALIRSRNIGTATDLQKLEAECLQLIETPRSPQETGTIYATIAFIYSDKGYSSRQDIRASRGIDYCKKALGYPLDPVTTCQMYVVWADALQTKYRGVSDPGFSVARREIAVVCLVGLKIPLDNDAARETQKLPVVNRYDYVGPADDLEYNRLRQKHNEEVAARKKAIRENVLSSCRTALKEKCVNLYTQPPYDKEELRHFAEPILPTYGSFVKELIKAVEAETDQ